MEFTWTQAIPWTLTAASFIYLVLKDHGAKGRAQEQRLRDLEVAAITDRLNHQHQLELMQAQVVSAQTTVQETRNLITKALNGN
jgi:hypothetical protein